MGAGCGGAAVRGRVHQNQEEGYLHNLVVTLLFRFLFDFLSLRSGRAAGAQTHLTTQHGPAERMGERDL